VMRDIAAVLGLRGAPMVAPGFAGKKQSSLFLLSRVAVHCDGLLRDAAAE
jgi:hypothetical protein